MNDQATSVLPFAERVGERINDFASRRVSIECYQLRGAMRAALMDVLSSRHLRLNDDNETAIMAAIDGFVVEYARAEIADQVVCRIAERMTHDAAEITAAAQ